jgi:hypothetical protein
VKKRVQFIIHDITKSPLPRQYEVLLMMNLLYHYRETSMRERILLNLCESAVQRGWLVSDSSHFKGTEYEEYEEFMKTLENTGWERREMLRIPGANVYRKC